MKTRPTPREQTSADCRTIGAATGESCVLTASGSRNGPHGGRNLLVTEAPEKSQGAIIKCAVNAAKKKEKDSYAARLAHLKKELAHPHLTKSVREKATKKQIASWSAG